MKKYGLIGYPLSHSFSADFFTKKFQKECLEDHSYELFPLTNISDLEQMISKDPEIRGLNVTIPHKIGVIYYMDKLDEAAREIDAVNCIRVLNSLPVEAYFAGELSALQVTLHGYNTDAWGFEKSLVPLLKKHHKRALVLGNGGAARAVTYILKKLNIDYILVSRRPTKNQLKYKDLNAEMMRKHLLIINTTPLGQSPDTGTCPEIPYEHLTTNHLLYDLVYNPEETEFLKRGKDKGAVIKNGLEMLHLQAEKSWEIWNS